MSSESKPKTTSALGRILKFAVVLALLLVVLFVAVGMFVLDGKYDVVREVTIQASPTAVHRQVGDLREWPNWLPFTKHDKSVLVTIEKPTGVGAKQHWSGKDGKGELEFTSCDPEKGVQYSMIFDEKWRSLGTISYAPAGEQTRVTWRMTGQNEDFTGKWFALLMPSMVGPMFEEGLNDLKTKVESDAKSLPEGDAKPAEPPTGEGDK